MRKYLLYAVLATIFLQTSLIAVCATGGGTAADRFRNKERDHNSTKGDSEMKTDEQQRRERAKDITKRRKGGEVIPWTALSSYEMMYENEVTANGNKEHKGDSTPHPERIALLVGCVNQTEYPITAVLLHVKLVDETGAIVSEGDIKADVSLAAWEAKRTHAVCVEATTKELSELVGKINRMLHKKSIKTEAEVKQILWKNNKVTTNTP